MAPHCPHLSSSVQLFEYSENCQCSTPNVYEHVYSQSLVYMYRNYRWWLRVTLRSAAGNISHRGSEHDRRHEFQDFVRLIDYKLIRLLDNTVSLVKLEYVSEQVSQIKIDYSRASWGQIDNRFLKIARDLQVTIKEDPRKVRYPNSANFPDFPRYHVSRIVERKKIHNGVYSVSIPEKTNKCYVLKAVDRENYKPYHSDVIEKELVHLDLFHGVPNIVQAVGVTVCSNPYKTGGRTHDPRSYITGILYKTYSGGTLRHALTEDAEQYRSWKKWPLQIGRALRVLHAHHITHKDLKPDNVVLDSAENAVIIDISGIGGVTPGWIAPELFGDRDWVRLPFHQGVLHDTWAYGKLLSWIAANGSDTTFRLSVLQLADMLMHTDPEKRMRLSVAVRQLEYITPKEYKH